MSTIINYTDIYNFFFLGPNTETARFINADQQRMQALEIQLFELFSMFGNGVLNGWEISTAVVTATSGPRIYITAGNGHVYYKYAATTDSTGLDLVLPYPLSNTTAPVTYYIYGVETETTNYDKSISFQGFTAPQTDAAYIYLGRLSIGVDSNGKYVITEIDYTDRDTINIFSTLSELIRKHVHLGGTNPPKINLRRHVAGVLPGDFIEASLDASQVTTGKLSLDRLPQISHDLLANRGTLTHSQFDTLFGLLETTDYERLDDVARTVIIELVIALKKVFFNIDQTLINTFAYIPGVTSSDYVDLVRTTAVIDAETQQIVGIQASPATSDFTNWTGEIELQYAYDQVINPANSGLVVVDDALELDTPLNFRSLHARSGTGAMAWESHVESTATQAGTGGVVPVDVKVELWQFQRFKDLSGTYIPQDWSKVNKLQFGFRLVDPTLIEHGDIYFFLIGPTNEIGANRTILHTVGSTTYSLSISAGVKVISFNQQTSDSPDNILTVSVDLLQWPNRFRNVLGYGFYVSTENGWNPEQAFDFELHQVAYTAMNTDVATYLRTVDPYSVGDEGNITMYAYNDLYHASEGRIIFRLHQPLTTHWDYVYWDVDVGEVADDVTPARVTVYTRTANQVDALPFQTEALVSEADHKVGSPDSYYIDVVVRFRASSNLEISPKLSALTLYYTTSSVANSKSFATVEEFNSGLTKTNISILSNPDRMELSDASLVNAIFFLEGDNLMVLDDGLQIIHRLNFDGSNLYETPRQAFAKIGAGFRGPLGLQVLENGHFVIADTKNDRVVELDGDGKLYRAIQGNVYLPLAARDFVALSAYYNERLGKVFVCFSQNINANFVKDKFTLSTTDRTNNIQFLSDSDATFYTLNTPESKSAVLVIELSPTRKTQVDSWSARKVLIIAQGGVTGISGSTTGMPIDMPPGSQPGVQSLGSVSAQATTTLPPNDLYDSFIGTISTFDPETGGTPPATTVEDETTVFDFNGDGKVDATVLMDVNGETALVTVTVEDADVVFGNVQYPVYAEQTGSNNYVIGQAYSQSVLNIGMDESVVWTIDSTMVGFDSQKPGTATLLADGTLLCASPTLGKVLQIVPSTKAVIFSHSPQQTPIFTVRLDNGNTIVVESDQTETGLNSRVYEIDIYQDVVKEWGLGRLKRPTGISVLENGNWLISC